jgi:hypothetical protein
VPKEVWDFHVGGYQVCEKWLKDRRARKLSFDDLMHYQKVVVALQETRRLMEEIDRAIPGWPIEGGIKSLPARPCAPLENPTNANSCRPN